MVLVMGSVAFDTIGLVPRLPEAEATARVTRVVEANGGAAGNVSRALARLGAHPRLAASVGDDFAGSAYERALITDGVDLSLLARVREPTAHAYIFSETDATGQMLFFHAGASARTREVAFDHAAIGHFAAGEISAYPAFMGGCDFVTFDPGQEIFHRDLSEILACIPHVDVLFLNTRERRTLTRAGFDLDAFLATRGKALIETHGGDGCDVHTRDSGPERVPALKAEVADPTGAGDAHRAGFLLGLTHKLPLVLCARLGNVAASFAIEKVGPQEGLARLPELRARYESAFGSWPLASRE